MNIQEYISGGMVESYVLGLLTEQERYEFEKICEAYPEVKAAREAFELDLEKQARENAIAPPAALKQKIENAIFTEKKLPSVAPIELAPVRKINILRLVAAASIILLAGSIWWNMNLRSENKGLKDQLSQSEQRVAEMMHDAKKIQDAGMKMVSMKGTAMSPGSYTTVYWDTTSHDVYLLVNNLPNPASDQQYQLWAIINGQPADMGMIEITKKPLQLYQMKNVQNAQAFAITLEKKGGSPKPSMDKMFVIGNL